MRIRILNKAIRLMNLLSRLKYKPVAHITYNYTILNYIIYK
ncbi:hypothetical protein SAMN05660909_02555 [Chitinophaga terrae (ex Kim and Jung 2007)]|uniref:Uncharacterized protein n=1 Tax=Chitinophaga terrae (ex Kim and Jung 2007) TaxID=408074 RepID=A0A1H4CD38_9BACT|nr:hypothetical protein [Chitinophaga terrae (ex Kim and Jung 2007)]SEA58229.1 hypothetical protein SAMN05660909_02555 [Chitinophaga terrae (ex Kim and Jung 2007)]